MTATHSYSDELLARGYALVPISRSNRLALDALDGALAAFFSRSQSDKERHACPNFHFGFRPYGRQYSSIPERPDLNESFTYWGDNPTYVPAHQELTTLMDAMHNHWSSVSELADHVLSALATHFGSAQRIDFRRSSYLEANAYNVRSSRPLLQDRHEDGHLLTIAYSNRPGLEIEAEGRMTPVEGASDHFVLMPGSLMTALTGAVIKPMFHQVRDLGFSDRRAVLFLVNPPFDRPTVPFVSNATNVGVDLGRLARSHGAVFGLPPPPILEDQ